MFSCITNESLINLSSLLTTQVLEVVKYRSLEKENVLDDSIVVRGKTGRRIVKLNNQAKEVRS